MQKSWRVTPPFETLALAESGCSRFIDIKQVYNPESDCLARLQIAILNWKRINVRLHLFSWFQKNSRNSNLLWIWKFLWHCQISTSICTRIYCCFEFEAGLEPLNLIGLYVDQWLIHPPGSQAVPGLIQEQKKTRLCRPHW